MLPVGDHLKMLSAQYLASAMRPGHPAHEPVCQPARRRNKKQTLQSRHLDDVAPLLVDGLMPNPDSPAAKKSIHTRYVSDALTKQGNHPLLNRQTPKVKRTEKTLSRHYRSTLSQLRSGHCASLEAYRLKVGRADTPACPQCKAGDQDVAHLFDCAATPTNLTIDDLWLRPRSVATFLSNHPSSALPPLDAPPPRPPPEPPP